MTNERPASEVFSLAQQCVDICRDRNAEDVRLYCVSGTSLLAEYYLICTGKSTPHIRAIRDHLLADLRSHGTKPSRVEGDPASQWTVMDYGTVLVHIFSPEMRQYYLLEELWSQAELVSVDEIET